MATPSLRSAAKSPIFVGELPEAKPDPDSELSTVRIGVFVCHL